MPPVGPTPHRSLHQRYPYASSPLHNSLTPPPQYDVPQQPRRDSDLEPFPSIESSTSSTSRNFALSTSPATTAPKLEYSSPVMSFNSVGTFANQQRVGNHNNNDVHRLSNPSSSTTTTTTTTTSTSFNGDVNIYCANCRRPWSLNDCYACTECISGVCRECVGMLIGSPPTSFLSASVNGPLPGKSGPTSFPNRGCPRCRSVEGFSVGCEVIMPCLLFPEAVTALIPFYHIWRGGYGGGFSQDVNMVI